MHLERVQQFVTARSDGGWCVLLQIQFDFNRNKYFDTKEALEYGIIDQVVRPLRTQTLGV